MKTFVIEGSALMNGDRRQLFADEMLVLLSEVEQVKIIVTCKGGKAKRQLLNYFDYLPYMAEVIVSSAGAYALALAQNAVPTILITSERDIPECIGLVKYSIGDGKDFLPVIRSIRKGGCHERNGIESA